MPKQNPNSRKTSSGKSGSGKSSSSDDQHEKNQATQPHQKQQKLKVEKQEPGECRCKNPDCRSITIRPNPAYQPSSPSEPSEPCTPNPPCLNAYPPIPLISEGTVRPTDDVAMGYQHVDLDSMDLVTENTRDGSIIDVDEFVYPEGYMDERLLLDFTPAINKALIDRIKDKNDETLALSERLKNMERNWILIRSIAGHLWGERQYTYDPLRPHTGREEYRVYQAMNKLKESIERIQATLIELYRHSSAENSEDNSTDYSDELQRLEEEWVSFRIPSRNSDSSISVLQDTTPDEAPEINNDENEPVAGPSWK